VRPELIEFFEKNPQLLEKLLNDTITQADAGKSEVPPIDLLSWMTSEYYSFVEKQQKPGSKLVSYTTDFPTGHPDLILFLWSSFLSLFL
jgi:hypothetical protein